MNPLGIILGILVALGSVGGSVEAMSLSPAPPGQLTDRSACPPLAGQVLVMLWKLCLKHLGRAC